MIEIHGLRAPRTRPVRGGSDVFIVYLLIFALLLQTELY